MSWKTRKSAGKLPKAGKAWLLGGLALAALASGRSLQAADAESPDAVLAEQDDPPVHIEQRDRRDPFTFTKQIEVVATPDLKNIRTERGPNLPPEQVEEKRKAAEELCHQAESSLMTMNAQQSLADCDKGLEVFKNVPNIADPQLTGLQVLHENLLRVRKAAQQVLAREQANVDFSRLNLRITGIVARQKRPQAIINGEIVDKGAIIGTSKDNKDAVVVEDILPEQVIFLFHGYEMSLSLSEIER